MSALRVRLAALFVLVSALLVGSPAAARTHKLDFWGGFPTITPFGDEEVLLVGAKRTNATQPGDPIDVIAVVWNVRRARATRSAKVAEVRTYPDVDQGLSSREGLAVRLEKKTLLFLDGASESDIASQLVEIDDDLRVVRKERIEPEFLSSAVVVPPRFIATTHAMYRGEGLERDPRDAVRVVLRDKDSLAVVSSRVLYGDEGTRPGSYRHDLVVQGNRLLVALQEGSASAIASLRVPSLVVEKRRIVTQENEHRAPAVGALPDRVVVFGLDCVELSPDLDRVLGRYDSYSFNTTFIVADASARRFAGDARARRDFPRRVAVYRERWSSTVDVVWTSLGAVALGVTFRAPVISDPFF